MVRGCFAENVFATILNQWTNTTYLRLIMGKLIVRRRKSRSPQVGDMRERIVINSRKIGAPTTGSAAFRQTLTPIGDPVWASVETLKGVEVFDDVAKKSTSGGITAGATHFFTTRYRDDVTFANIITFDGNNYKILPVDNPDLRKRWLFLFCALLGDDVLEANK